MSASEAIFTILFLYVLQNTSILIIPLSWLTLSAACATDVFGAVRHRNQIRKEYWVLKNYCFDISGSVVLIWDSASIFQPYKSPVASVCTTRLNKRCLNFFDIVYVFLVISTTNGDFFLYSIHQLVFKVGTDCPLWGKILTFVCVCVFVCNVRYVVAYNAVGAT